MMDLKKKFRDFFTLSRKANGGFTLVELIVVIAILAILGGVAVPAYSGYVAKADIAADQVLLNAVNKAFASACAENGTDAYNVPEQPELKLTADKAVDEVTPYAPEFDKYFAGNEDATFKTDNAIVFDGLKGAFVLMTEGTSISLKYGSGFITISAEDAKKLADSTFNTAEGLGIEGLLNKVDFIADFAAGVNSNTYDSILLSPEYKKSFLKNLGIDATNLDGRDLDKAYGNEISKMANEMLDKMAKENGWTEEQKEEHRTDAEDKVKANMAVLYAAQSTNSLNDAQVNNLLNTNDPKSTILAGATSGDSLAQAALYYGMYTSFAYSKEYGNADRQDATKEPLTLLTTLDDAEIKAFQVYVNSDQGKADLEAYMASMNMITDSATNAGAVNNVVVNGFSDSELMALLQQVVGK